MRLATVALVLALAAPAAAQTPSRAEVGLSGRGNEPGWSVEVARGRVTLVTDYGSHKLSLAVTGVSGGGDAPLAVTAGANGAPLVVVREVPGLCFDTMSGAPFPYGVEVSSGERNYSGCGGSTAELLSGTEWRVEDIDGRGVIDGSDLTMAFDPRGRVEGTGGCNRFSGPWRVEEGWLVAGPLRSTRRACAAKAMMAQEAAFFAALAQPLSFSEAPGGLLLTGQGGATLILRPGEASARVRPRWRPSIAGPLRP